MTTRHLIDGVMQMIGARNDRQCSIALGVEHATICRMRKGKSRGMYIETLDKIQRASGVPAEKLLDWYRMPEGAVLGRVRAEVAP